MAQFSHLPLYVKTYEFVKLVYRTVKQFRKEYKYTLGMELEKMVWEILDEIIDANSLPDTRKEEAVKNVSRLFDKFKIRFRLAYEVGLIPAKKFGTAQTQMEEIGRMIGGWHKWSQGVKDAP